MSKLYIKKFQRGQGVGLALLDFIEGRCKAHGFTTLWLTVVNRFNKAPVE